MGWVLRLVETGIDGSSGSVDVLEIVRPGDLGDLAALGLTLADGRQLLTQVQQAVVRAQSRDHTARWPECRTCTTLCQEGLSAPSDCDRVRPGHAPAAAFPLCRLRWSGGWCRLAVPLPLDARARP